MNKNLLFALLFFTTFISCDERKTVESLTPIVAPTTKTKTELISRKWGISESYFDVDAKKTIVYGVGAVSNPNLTTDITPDDYITFTKDGKIESYSGLDKKTLKGTWKFLNNETQIQFPLDGAEFVMDIISLTEKDAEIAQKIVIANLANETQTSQGIIFIVGLGGLTTKDSKVVKLGLKLKAK